MPVTPAVPGSGSDLKSIPKAGHAEVVTKVQDPKGTDLAHEVSDYVNG